MLRGWRSRLAGFVGSLGFELAVVWAASSLGCGLPARTAAGPAEPGIAVRLAPDATFVAGRRVAHTDVEWELRALVTAGARGTVVVRVAPGVRFDRVRPVLRAAEAVGLRRVVLARAPRDEPAGAPDRAPVAQVRRSWP